MIAMTGRLILMTIFLALALFVGGCAELKPLAPLDPARKAAVLEGCRRPFLQASCRLVHSLETIMPGGTTGTAIGVMTADPRTGRFRTTFMTIEGMVLFDVEAGEGLIVHRAVPPFDAPAFAGGLAEDIRLAFFHPGREPVAWGAGEGGAPVCRFQRIDGRFVEVLTNPDGSVGIVLYGAGQELLKRVKMAPLGKPGPAGWLEIREGWPTRYTLRLRLLESKILDGDPGEAPAATNPGSEPSVTGGASEEGTRIP